MLQVDNSKFTSRELSWLEFNKRVLDMAKDKNSLLLDRLKYISIVSSNLTEFISVRMGALENFALAGDNILSINGLKPSEELSLVYKEMKKHYFSIYDSYAEIIKELKVKGYNFIEEVTLLDNDERNYLRDYFDKNILYSLTPTVFDETRPFPTIKSGDINLCIVIDEDNLDYNMIGIIQIPSHLDRFVLTNKNNYITIEEVIKLNLDKLYVDKKITDVGYYRLIRNNDILEERIENNFIVNQVSNMLNKRKIGTTMICEIKSSSYIEEIIKKAHKIKDDRVILHSHFLDIQNCNKFKEINEMEKLKSELFKSQKGIDFLSSNNVFKILNKKKEIILHHPYETFDHVIDFIRQAANDPSVISIKQTIYRLAKKSPVMEALIEAAKNGKNVTCLLEVTARFDEEANIYWAKALEEAGGHVVYGINDFKTHCKLLLVTRKEKDGTLKNYCQIGTGNYNNVTSKVYTDISYLTADKRITHDVATLFNVLTGHSIPKLNHVISAPHSFRREFGNMINNEIKCAKEGKEAIIKIKCNSLNDEEIIEKLYEASLAGVKIELIIRGACCLKTKEEYSKNIKVKSIIGDYLEHSRIYYFHNDKNKLYIASADLMWRNLEIRYEVLVPLLNKETYNKVLDIFNTFINDDSAYILEGETYKKLNGKNGSQKLFIERAKNNNKKKIKKIFIKNR